MNQVRMLTSSLQYCIKVDNQCNKTRKKKRCNNWEGKSNSTTSDYITVYIDHPGEFTNFQN